MTGNLLILTVLAVFGLVLVYATYLSAREWSILYTLNRQGVETLAKVENLTKDTQGRGEKNYALYHFYVDGVPYENRQQISKQHYTQLKQAKELNIRYLPSSPSISRLAGKDFDNTYRNLVSFVAFAAAIIIPPTIAVWILSFIFSKLLLHARGLPEKKKA
ncbi:MAG: hypothetical protein H6672_06655 [Anaerolineaceae bacterium]|nr:hypothetical protein [Anaerolineaceae bacterium]